MISRSTGRLIRFVGDRLTFDELVAREAMSIRRDGTAHDPDSGCWEVANDWRDSARIEGDDIVIYDEGGHTIQQARHIARHDPARVLRDVEAKRRIWLKAAGYTSSAIADTDFKAAWETVLEELASIWSDHPDYEKDWEPVR